MLARGKRETAESFIDSAMALERGNAQAWFLKGDSRRLAGDLEAAVSHYDRAIELNSRCTPARINRAALLIDLQREDEAMEDIEHVRNEFPNHPQAAYLNALVLASRGDIDGAEASRLAAASTLETLRAQGLSGHAPSLLLSGIIDFKKGNYERARTALESYLKLAPSHIGARKILATLFARQGDIKKAIEVLHPGELRVRPARRSRVSPGPLRSSQRRPARRRSREGQGTIRDDSRARQRGV